MNIPACPYSPLGSPHNFTAFDNGEEGFDPVIFCSMCGWVAKLLEGTGPSQSPTQASPGQASSSKTFGGSGMTPHPAGPLGPLSNGITHP